MVNKAKIGASIVLDGEKDFKDAVTGCNKKLSALRTELSAVKEKYVENANSLNALQEKKRFYQIYMKYKSLRLRQLIVLCSMHRGYMRSWGLICLS